MVPSGSLFSPIPSTRENNSRDHSFWYNTCLLQLCVSKNNATKWHGIKILMYRWQIFEKSFIRFMTEVQREHKFPQKKLVKAMNANSNTVWSVKVIHIHNTLLLAHCKGQIPDACQRQCVRSLLGHISKTMEHYTVGHKKRGSKLLSITLVNLNQFWQILYSHNWK